MKHFYCSQFTEGQDSQEKAQVLKIRGRSTELQSTIDYHDLDYPDFSISGLFLWSQFGYDYLLVTIKIRSHILFKTTALKGAVKCKGFFLLSKSKGGACACPK